MNKQSTKAVFWVYFDGAFHHVKLAKDEEKTFHFNRDCDEGWEAKTCTYTFDGEGVFFECWAREQDCDGRHESLETYYAPLSKLAALDCKDEDGEIIPGMKRPEFEKEKASQRDHYAEAAGY